MDKMHSCCISFSISQTRPLVSVSEYYLVFGSCHYSGCFVISPKQSYFQLVRKRQCCLPSGPTGRPNMGGTDSTTYLWMPCFLPLFLRQNTKYENKEFTQEAGKIQPSERKQKSVEDGCKYYSVLAESIWAIPQDFTFTAYKFSPLANLSSTISSSIQPRSSATQFILQKGSDYAVATFYGLLRDS